MTERSHDQEIEVPGMRLLQPIGQGAYSVVYLAERESSGAKYAVKVLRKSVAGGANAAKSQLIREAATLACLSHPGLVSILEANESQDRPFLVMEYVPGGTLADLLEKGRPTEAEVLSLGKGLAGALNAVHRRGLVHRDIKPQNILIQSPGRAKLIDFGLAARQAPEEPGKEGEAAGTFLYSAPEQTGLLKRPVDGRADLYSLGVVLFECVTGRLPFMAPSAAELIRMHAVDAPPDPRSLNPAVSAALSGIIERLLSKDPDDRYQDGATLEADLGKLLGASASAHASTHETPLIGREQELAKLLAASAVLSDGKGAAVLIDGEPGSGKSRLVRELIDRCEAKGNLTLEGKCPQGELLPLVPLRQAIERCLAKGHAERIREAAGDLAPLLKGISPRLGELFAGVADLPESSVSLNQFYTAIQELFVNLARASGGLVLFVDDVQWLDDGSRQVLHRLFAQLDKAPLLLVCTARKDAASRASVERFVSDAGSALALHLTTAPLAGEAVAKLISAHLGNRDLEGGFVDKLARLSGGSPFAIGEYVRTSIDSALLRPSWRESASGSTLGWQVDLAGFERLDLPTDAVQLVVKRVDSAEPAMKRVLGAAALIGSRFRLELLPEVCSLDPGVVNGVINAAVAAHFIERSAHEEYSFIHDNVREALLRSFKSEQSREMHRCIADVLELHPQPKNPDFLYALARQTYLGYASESPAKLYKASLQAGLAATQAFADEEAHVFLRRALESAGPARVAPDPALFSALAEVCLRTGKLDEADEHLKKVLEISRDPQQRTLTCLRLSGLHISHHDAVQSAAYLEQAYKEFGKPYPKSRLLQLVTMLGHLALVVLSEKTGLLHGTAKGRKRERLKTLTALYDQGGHVAYALLDSFLMIQLVVRSLYAAKRLGFSTELVSAYCSTGTIMSFLKKKQVSAMYMQKAKALATQLNIPSLIARAAVFEGICVHLYGNCVEGQSIDERALVRYDRWLEIRDFGYGYEDITYNLSVRGYCREVLEWVKRASAKEAGSSGKTAVFNSYQSSALHSLAALGRTGEALKQYEQSMSMLEGLRKDEVYRRVFLYSHLAMFNLHQREFGAPFEEVIEGMRRLKVSPMSFPFHTRHFFVAQAYGRLAQAEASKSAEERGKRAGQLKEALSAMRFISDTDAVRCHFVTLKAGLSHVMGKEQRALSLLEQAERIAARADSPWASYEIHFMRARVYKALGHSHAASREARLAYSIALEHGWLPRMKEVNDQYQLGQGVINTLGVSGAASQGLRASPGSSTTQLKFKTQWDALRQLSLAAVSSIDPDQQARATLDEMVKILAAERACLFLVDEENGSKLVLKASRDSKGNELKELTGFSSTVVERVRSTREPLVVSGTEEGQLLGAQSVVAHDLRSIIAAPLLMRDQLMGVVYLDSHLAKGLFTQSDLEILMALASHIAVALETARAAKNEIERRAMEKDLAVSAAVQSFFLPKKGEFGHGPVSGAGYYMPATFCSGDWWWHDVQANGRTLIFIGDITGHGMGPAMLTAAIASGHQVLQRIKPEIQVREVFEVLHSNFSAQCGNNYWMSFAALEIEPGANRPSTGARGRLRPASWARAASSRCCMRPASRLAARTSRSIARRGRSCRASASSCSRTASPRWCSPIRRSSEPGPCARSSPSFRPATRCWPAIASRPTSRG
jgi:tRNA A-37 threonylcarbamoyl transferase component Bud32/tetratricopeptide (TPR) repeat protein